jgi:mannan endo-1,4-beta-mannosidase
VRLWAFNDVDTIPVNGTWLQLINKDGTTTFNTGPNGAQKLDTVVKLAQKHNLFVLLSLTNNWNPLPLVDNPTQSAVPSTPARRDVTQGTNNTLPRNFLSNDYGGMDVYVRQLGENFTHDQFYTNQTLIDAFKNYITNLVSRYVDSTAVFSWEIANDPRCSSSISQSPGCTTNTITEWHSIIAQHIRSIDPNHLISSGTAGFFCADCPKLFPPPAPAPAPRTSPVAGVTRRRRDAGPLSKARLLLEQTQLRKRNREAKKRAGGLIENGIKIRGRWASTPTRRQDTGVGPAFDGSSGVDCEDIGGIPQIGFLTFQLFPDQNVYGPVDPNLSPLTNTIQTGINWIKSHAQAGRTFNKPVALTGFGVVTQNNSQVFIPFNSTTPPFGPAPTASTRRDVSDPFGVTDDQRNDIYSQWLSAGLDDGINGMLQYQWGQTGLTTSPGTSISPDVTGASGSPDVTGTSESPNDGYSIGGVADDGAQQVLSNAAAAFS